MIPRNCLSVSLDRLHDQGGYIALRASQHKGGWLHALHVAKDGQIHNYRPAEKLSHPLKALTGFDAEASNDDRAFAPPAPLSAILVSAWIFAFGATAWALDRFLRRFFSA